MGKWSQYRRRGSGSQQSEALGPPPAPVLTVSNGDFTINASGGDDTGGTSILFYSVTGAEPGTQVDSQPWATSVDSMPTTDVPVGFAWAVEIGNGTAYEGTSPRSNLLPSGV